MTENVDLVISDGIAHLTLNRPEAANSFDLPTATAFGEAVDQISASSDVRAVLLSGAGKRFCAGGDVASFHVADDPQAYLRELADVLDAAMQRFSALPVATVVAVQGAAAGAGLSVMLGADLIVASRSTKFVTAYAGIGLTPDIGLSWLLPRAVGQVRFVDQRGKQGSGAHGRAIHRLTISAGKKMVGVRGFEPPTPASRTQCSTRLSHTPTDPGDAPRRPRKRAYSDAAHRRQAPHLACCMRRAVRLSRPLSRRCRGYAGPAGEWCNGNTAVFGTVILGSSPSSPATDAHLTI